MTGALGRTWIAAAALTAGIVLRPPGWVAVGALLLFVRRAPAASLAGLICATAALGAGAAARGDVPAGALDALARRASSCTVAGSVREHHGALGTLVSIRNVACGRAAATGGTAVTSRLDADAGATVRLEGRLRPLGDDGFDLLRRRLGAQVVLDVDDVASGRVTSPPLALAARIREGLRAATRRLDEDRAALVRGLTTGDTRGLDEGTEMRLRRAGLTHLVAVSGSNVAIVMGAVLLAARRMRAVARVALAAAGLSLFVLVVGPEPSVLRAAAMGAAALGAMVAGTRAPPLHALGLAVIVVLALRPALAYSAGLQLSVAATAGIILWAKSLARRLPFPEPLAAVFGVTLAAQAAVVPVLVFTFGDVPVAGLPANLLAVPVVPPATVLGFGAALLGAANPVLAEIPARAAAPLAGWILWVGNRFGAPGWATVSLPPVAGWITAAVLSAAVLETLRRRAVR